MIPDIFKIAYVLILVNVGWLIAEILMNKKELISLRVLVMHLFIWACVIGWLL